MSELTLADGGVAQSASRSTVLYRAVWRWHFYAGLYVIPFLLMLAITGLIMMLYAGTWNELGRAPDVTPTGQAKPVSTQARSALAAVPGGVLETYIAPEAANRPAYFEIGKDGSHIAVAIDPYSATVLASQDETASVRAIAEKIHGTLLIGDVGDRLIEVAASLSIILIATGLYMWWPRDGKVVRALFPSWPSCGRPLWKEIHRTTGVWISFFLLLFMVSGLAWTGIWGDSFVKPWSSFPANKWDDIPLSDLTHADLNHDVLHEVPWGLEITPLPASGSTSGVAAVPSPVTLDSVAQWAAANGFSGQYKLAVPANEKGVYSVSRDGRNEDGANPSHDRFVHIDRYTGNVLADIRYDDYKPVAKMMAWGIALHKGMAGTWNFVFNLAYLALVVLLCVSGIVMWWKRRPSGALAAPLYPREYRLTAGVIAIAVVLGVLFPLGGLAILAFAAIDAVLPRRWKTAGLGTV